MTEPFSHRGGGRSIGADGETTDEPPLTRIATPTHIDGVINTCSRKGESSTESLTNA